jgi:hypothetical protein
VLLQKWQISSEVLCILNSSEFDIVADSGITEPSETRVFIYSI